MTPHLSFSSPAANVAFHGESYMDDTQIVAAVPVVQARAQQGYELNLNLNFVPGRDAISTVFLRCQPRQGALRVEADPIGLPSETLRLLRDSNRKMIEWLARDGSHQSAFIADPVEAFARAGIDIERAHVKALRRVREALGGAEAITPGLQVMSVRTSVDVNGKVKAVDQKSNVWVAPATEQGWACGPKTHNGNGA
jgi:hypothetical protein